MPTWPCPWGECRSLLALANQCKPLIRISLSGSPRGRHGLEPCEVTTEPQARAHSDSSHEGPEATQWSLKHKRIRLHTHSCSFFVCLAALPRET